MLREAARAKINLYLHVTGRRADGYHELDSIVVFADVHDGITAAPSDGLTLELEGTHAPGLAAETLDSNLVMRAASALRELAGVRQGAALTLTKDLPVASGIGGGSADAAATIRLLVKFWNLTIEPARLLDLALSLGADVPVCLRNAPARMTGIGEVLTPAPAMPRLPAVLVNPGTPVPTGAVFAGLDLTLATTRAELVLPAAFPDAAGLAAFLAGTRNDLERPAIAQAPVIADVLYALERTDGALIARMSGSGGTCFALYETPQAARDAAARLRRAMPGWWTAETMLG
jgi:4-diphosphocytidyl-2-C-methyl-D-erythritol kinase